jgi:hypothetical protein
VFFVRVNHAIDLGVRLGELGARVDRLIEPGTLGSRDIDEDLGRVTQVLVQLVQVALVALLHEVAAAFDGQRTGVVEGILHVVPQGRTLE